MFLYAVIICLQSRPVPWFNKLIFTYIYYNYDTARLLFRSLGRSGQNELLINQIAGLLAKYGYK